MPKRLSRSQVERLGKRLAAADEIDSADLEMLEALRSQHNEPLDEVVDRLRALGLRPTSRLKTTGTMVEKLRREHGMNLSRMDDVAGARVVLDGGTRAQDEVIGQLSETFAEAKLRDRREEPSFGYRAVHVVPRIGAHQVEIQVRTRLQDLWAQMMERLADEWGRQIRYGQPPHDADEIASQRTDRPLTRADVVDLLQLASSAIASLEDAQAGHESINAMLVQWEEVGQERLDELAAQAVFDRIDVAAVRREIDEVEEALQLADRRTQDVLRKIARVFLGSDFP